MQKLWELETTCSPLIDFWNIGCTCIKNNFRLKSTGTIFITPKFNLCHLKLPVELNFKKVALFCKYICMRKKSQWIEKIQKWLFKWVRHAIREKMLNSELKLCILIIASHIPLFPLPSFNIWTTNPLWFANIKSDMLDMFVQYHRVSDFFNSHWKQRTGIVMVWNTTIWEAFLWIWIFWIKKNLHIIRSSLFGRSNKNQTLNLVS